MLFCDPHNEMKCVLSIIESYSIEKNGSKFSHLLSLQSGLRWLTTPLPLTVSLTVKCSFFYDFPFRQAAKYFPFYDKVCNRSIIIGNQYACQRDYVSVSILIIGWRIYVTICTDTRVFPTGGVIIRPSGFVIILHPTHSVIIRVPTKSVIIRNFSASLLHGITCQVA